MIFKDGVRAARPQSLVIDPRELKEQLDRVLDELGAQNVRVPNEGALAGNGLRYDSEDRILPAARVSPIVAWISRDALDAIGGFPPLNWYSALSMPPKH